jgi:hypothetical protein
LRVAEDAERHTLWREVILAQAPWRRRHEKKPDPVIPVAVLTPVNPAMTSPITIVGGHSSSRHPSIMRSIRGTMITAGGLAAQN